MRQFIFAVMVLTFSACSGGGGGTTADQTAPTNQPATTQPTSDPATTQPSANTESTPKTFSGISDPITVDDIVNQTSDSAQKSIGATQYYFGRFLSISGGQVYSGAVKFQIIKSSDSAVYFSNFSLIHLSKASSFSTKVDLVTDEKNLNVTAQHNSSTNFVSIASATSRFVKFSIDFGNNDYFGDVSNAGVIFSSDYSTMAGGDDSFIFIAQKTESMADVTEGALSGNWKVINFFVAAGVPVISSTSTVAVGGSGGSGFTAFTGINSKSGKFGGELALNDPVSAFFLYGYGVDGSTTAAGPIHGVFLVAPDKSLAVGYDIDSKLYFAAER